MLVSTAQALGFRQRLGKVALLSLPFPVFPQTSMLRTLVFKQWHSENLRCKGIGHLKDQQVNMIGWRNNPESTDAEYKEKDFGDTVLCGTLRSCHQSKPLF